MIKKWLFVVVVLCFSIQSMAAKLQVGDAVPDTLGKDINGNEINASTYKGKVLVVTFWATWCGPCKKELPILGSLQRKVGNEKIQVVAINFGDEKKNFKFFANQMLDHPLKITYDQGDRIGKHFGIQSIPNLWIVDRNGMIVGHHIGYNEANIRDLLTEIIDVINGDSLASQSTQ